MSLDKSVYRYETRVFGYDSDMRHRMKISSVLKEVQTVAGFHLDENGMSFDRLKENNSIFVMTKASLNLLRTPVREEKIVLKTWTRGLDGIVFIRDTVIETTEGERLSEASVNWILVDPVKHGILRPEALRYDIVHRPDIALLGTRTGRLRTPKDLIAVGTKRVDYTDCDFIGHMNNTNYADIVTNFLPENDLGKEISECDIVYSLEAKLGETITVFRGEENGILFFRGEHSRGKCFEARVRIN